MIEYLVLSTYCILLESSPDFSREFQKLEEIERYNVISQALHCTDWVQKTLRNLGFSREKVFYGWKIPAGDALSQEIAPIQELLKIKRGWAVDFVNNNEFTGRHSIIVEEVVNRGEDFISVIGLTANFKRDEVQRKMYRFISRDSKKVISEDIYATINVPVIAIFRPKKNE